MDMVGRIIAAEIFHDGAGDGVADEVGGKDLAVEFFAPEQPGQQKVKQKVIQRVINFRRMHAGMSSGVPEIACAWRSWKTARPTAHRVGRP